MIWAKHHANKKSRAAHLNHLWEGYDYSKMHSNQLEQMVSPGLEVIKREFILRLKIKHNDWLLADTCPQSANHCALF